MAGGEESCNAVGCCYNERAAAGRKDLQLSARQRCFPFNAAHISRSAGPAEISRQSHISRRPSNSKYLDVYVME